MTSLYKQQRLAVGFLSPFDAGSSPASATNGNRMSFINILGTYFYDMYRKRGFNIKEDYGYH